MDKKPELLYLDLLKKALSFMLWPEPPVLVGELEGAQSAFERYQFSKVTRLVRGKGLYFAKTRDFTDESRHEGEIWPGYADTMVGIPRLDNIQSCIESVLAEGVEGDLIETGVWRGGACIFMRAVLAAYGVSDRRVFVADSFEGLPKPDAAYPADAGDDHHLHSFLAVSQEDVEENFRRYGLLDDKVVFLKGWFADTLPSAPISKLAVLRLDGDMYGSTMDALRSLYPKLSRGGYCIVDDYGAVVGCRKAVEDYRSEHGITDEMHKVDWTGMYWRKS